MLVSERQYGDSNWVCDPVEDRLREALHEIRQPLSAVFALAECVRLTPDLPQTARGFLDRLIEEAAELAAAATSALDRSMTSDGVEVVRCDEVLDSIVDSFLLTWTGRLVRKGLEGSVCVLGRRVTLRRCLVNLVDNATRAAGPDGTVMVTLQRGLDQVRVVVEDDGPGFGCIPHGAGLGLELSRRALAPLGGSLEVGLRGELGGARVVVSLPVVADELPVSAGLAAVDLAAVGL